METKTPVQRLKSFGGMTRRSNKRLLVLFNKFHKILRHMSSSLLGALESLEQHNVLTSINTSPHEYEDLYRTRAETDKAFTISEYGTNHSALTLGRLDEETAKHRWVDIYKFSGTCREELAFFHIAYEVSGGLPLAFEKAAHEARLWRNRSKEITAFRVRLEEYLPNFFNSLFDSKFKFGGKRLISAVARFHCGSAKDEDVVFIDSHPWREIFIHSASGNNRLACGPMGMAAVGRYRHEVPHKGGILSTRRFCVDLYRRRLYETCFLILERENRDLDRTEQILLQSAKMMHYVFRHSPQNLYFDAEVNWKMVRRIGSQLAQDEGLDEESREEFRSLRRSENCPTSSLRFLTHPKTCSVFCPTDNSSRDSSHFD